MDFGLQTPSAWRVTTVAIGCCAIWLWWPELAQAAVTFGEMGQNVAENAKGVAKGVTLTGYAAAATMGVLGFVEMYKASRSQGQSTYQGGIIKLLVGALALGLGEFLGSGSATIFGSDQTTGLGELGIN